MTGRASSEASLFPFQESGNALNHSTEQFTNAVTFAISRLVLLSLQTALANSKRGLSKFHTMALRLVGIKVDDDMLPDLMMWRKVETAAAESEHSAGLRV
jgi:hypothetical protein